MLEGPGPFVGVVVAGHTPEGLSNLLETADLALFHGFHQFLNLALRGYESREVHPFSGAHRRIRLEQSVEFLVGINAYLSVRILQSGNQ